jgi:hypothetical protein
VRVDRTPSTVRALGVLVVGLGCLWIIGADGAFAADGLADPGSTVPPPSTPEGERRYRLVLTTVGAMALLAGLTGLVLYRRLVAEAARALADAVLEPHRRGRRRRARERLGQVLTTDVATGAAVRDALDGLAPVLHAPGAARLYSVVVTPAEVAAQVTTCGVPPHPWTVREDGRWVRPRPPAPGPRPSRPRFPRLVRVGVNDDGTVLVDLAQLDGVLSMTGTDDVSRDLLALLIHELLSGPGAPPPVAVLDPERLLPPVPGAAPVRAVGDLLARSQPAAPATAAVVAVATPQPEASILAVPTLPTAADAAAVAALCAPGQGWNALVVGEVPGAHWRWTTSADGTADLGLLGLRVTVPVVGL